ncbi:hypothetical protein ACFE04_024650 [Oxalis oulophora]
MEKQGSPERSDSFTSTSQSDNAQQNEEPLSLLLQETDRYIESIDASSPPSSLEDVPECVSKLAKMVESITGNYEIKTKRFGVNEELGEEFTQAICRLSRLHWIDRANSAVHRVMSFLEEELRSLLCTENLTPNTPKNNQSESPAAESQNRGIKEGEEIVFPGFSPETITIMQKISTVMISSGYENECGLIYGLSRRDSFNNVLHTLGLDKLSVEDVHKMQWDSLEGQITTWTTVVRHCTNSLFTGERKLCEAIFPDHPEISKRMFGDLANAVVFRFLNFAEAVILTKRSIEKLFKFLDMYETLRDMLPTLDLDSENDLKMEIGVAKLRLAEAAADTFRQLENSIKSDNTRTPVPSGAVHPLTRYTINYLEYLCDYKDTLEQVFDETENSEQKTNDSDDNNRNGDDQPKPSAFTLQLISVMDLLDGNLEVKSKLYKDPALRWIFLLNNGRYILQKIKGSSGIRGMMGVNWLRKRSSELRKFHKNYQRETWGRVLQCLSHEGLQQVSGGKVAKSLVKERFKSFNQMFDEIHKTQSTWVVSDEQMQSELRASISAVVIPAYRSFWGRFKTCFDNRRQSEKYIKYQPEDIESSIEDFFDGNPTSMARRRN